MGASTRATCLAAALLATVLPSCAAAAPQADPPSRDFVLLRVDGLPADFEHWAEIAEAMRQEGHRVRVDVRRGAEELRFEVPVVDIVR